jgi:hypothetical protein
MSLILKNCATTRPAIVFAVLLMEIILPGISATFKKKRGTPSLSQDEIPLCILFLPSIRFATQAAALLKVTVAELVEAGT